VDYDAVTGLKETDYSNINFIESILRAYVATGNSTYLTWLQNSWDSIIVYGLNSAYSSYLSVNGYAGALSSRINITNNAEDLYTGSIYDMLPFIDSSLLLYDVTANQTYLDVARNLTARIVDYRVNMTTGLTVMQYSPRRSAEAMYNESAGYVDLIRDSALYNLLNVMHERTSNETYTSIVNTFWDWLSTNWDYTSYRFWHNGDPAVSDAASIRQFPDTIEHYSNSLFNYPNATHLTYLVNIWDDYHTTYWNPTGQYYNRSTESAWLGAELNALLDLHRLTGNASFLTWARQSWDWHYNAWMYNGHLTSGEPPQAYVFSNWWDTGQALLRLWLLTDNSTYEAHLEEAWINNLANFTGTYGFVSKINLDTNAVIDATATCPLIRGYFDSYIYGLIFGLDSAIVGYQPPITPRIRLVANVEGNIITSQANITTASFSGNTLTFTLSASKTGTVSSQVYLPLGEPYNVDGVAGYSFDDSTNILTVTSSNEATVTVDFNPPYVRTVGDKFLASILMWTVLPLIFGGVLIVFVIRKISDGGSVDPKFIALMIVSLIVIVTIIDVAVVIVGAIAYA
jgi:hypothetical protein